MSYSLHLLRDRGGPWALNATLESSFLISASSWQGFGVGFELGVGTGIGVSVDLEVLDESNEVSSGLDVDS